LSLAVVYLPRLAGSQAFQAPHPATPARSHGGEPAAIPIAEQRGL